MSLESLGCSIREVDVPKKLAETGIDPSRRTDIENRLKQLETILNATSSGQKAGRAAEEAAIRGTILENMKRAGEMVRVSALAPDRARGFEQFLVHDLGVTKNRLGMGQAYTDGGWVRESMNRARRLWAGGLEKNIRDLGAIEMARKTYEPLRAELKKLKVADADLDYIFSTAYEQGWHPQIMRYAPPGQQGQKVLAGREINFRDHMVKKLGVPSELADRISVAGVKIAETQHDIGMLAQNAGVQFSRESFLNQLPRIVSDEAKMRFNWKYQDLKGGQIQFDDGSVDTIANILGKSHLTSEFAIEDEVLLDYVLRQVSVAKYGSPQALFDRATGVSGAGIADILDTRGGVVRTLIDLEGDTLDALVDTGLLSKVPLPTADIVNELKRVYDFPFEGIAEVFAVDWQQGMKVYTSQLERLAHKSGFVNQLVTQAVDGNWGVPKSVVENDATGLYAGFRPLVSPQGSRVPGVLPQSLLDRAGYQATRQREMGLMLENIYVHPTVAKLAQANIDLQMNPQALGALARFSHTTGKVFRNLAVATTEYVQRQFWNTVVAQHAGQGNILLVPHYSIKMLMSQLSGQGMEKFLDDGVKKFRLQNGEQLTELGLWRFLEDTGYISKYEPLTGTELNPGGYHNWNPLAVKRNLRWMNNTMQQFNGGQRLLEEIGAGGTALMEKATYPLKLSNNILDNAGRFAGLVATVSPVSAADGMRAITTQAILKHASVEEGIEHWKNFYFQYDDITYTDRMISNHVIPFWGFHAKNIPAAVRFVGRNPTRFMAYQRLYALANRPVSTEEQSQLTESTVPQWMLEGQTIFFGNKEDGYFGIPMGGLDPISSGLQWLTAPGEAVLEHFGIFPNSRVRGTNERIDQLPWNSGTKTNAAISALLDNTFPVYKAIAQTVSGKDTYGRPLESGSKTTSFLGYEVSPVFRIWAESLLPTLGTVNRMNPLQSFGTPAVRDARTGTWTPGTPSQMPGSGAVPRSDKDNFSTNNPYQNYAQIGVKIYPVDVWLNAGYSYDALRVNVSAGARFRQQLVDGLQQLEPGTPRYAERVKEIQEVDYLIQETRNQMNVLDDWAASQGINVRQAVGKLNEANRRVGDLPPANPWEQESPAPTVPPIPSGTGQ